MGNEKRARSLDEQIAEALRAAEASGEMRGARSYGKPLDLGDGYEDTPPELRMAFKVLKDAGCTPPEIAMLHDLASLRQQLAAMPPDEPEAQALRARINQLEIEVSLRVERLASRRL